MIHKRSTALERSLKKRIEQHFKQRKMYQNRFTRTTLSATVSKFVEENYLIIFLVIALHVKACQS